MARVERWERWERRNRRRWVSVESPVRERESELSCIFS